MERLIEKVTGQEITTFQGRYYGDSFVVDGVRGARERELADRWQSVREHADRRSLPYMKALAEMEATLSHFESSDQRTRVMELLGQIADHYVEGVFSERKSMEERAAATKKLEREMEGYESR